MIQKKDKLTLKEDAFCRMYVTADVEFFGNGTQSYLEVYNPSHEGKNWYDNASAAASEMLRKPKIYNRINELLDSNGLNDQNVDKQLLFLVNQHEDKNVKAAAIREYNKLKKRITEKVDLESGGKPIAFQVISFKDYKKKK
jgi:hypothetical protein